MWRTKTVIGEQSDLEKLLDQFLERMEQFDKRTSIKEQKTILRNAVKPAVVSLRSKTRGAYKRRTGRAWRSVRTKAAASRTRPGIAFTTYGWSDKGVEPIYTKRLRRDGAHRQRPKPARYIGIWGDLGTWSQPGKGIFKTEWASHKEQIKNSIEKQIIDIMRKTKISN